jgi:LysM repeat protein
VSNWRWNLHATIAALSATALVFGSAWSNAQSTPPAVSNPPRDSAVVLEIERPRSPEQMDADSILELMGGDPRPLIERVTSYRVQAGDTLNRIADRFGVSADTLQAANNLRDPNRLFPGQELTVLPVSGVVHTVRGGETVPDLAARYGFTTVRLAMANGLEEPYTVRPGQRLFVPGGRPLPTLLSSGGKADWPAPGTGDRNKRQFIEASAVAAQDSYLRTRVPVSVAIAQAIHESYWGTSKLAREANNFFGIKARNGEGSAGVYWMDAWEVLGGRDVVVPEPFRAYHTPDESFVDHGMFFVRNSRYHKAFAYVDDPRAFAEAVADAGYATDPSYAPKLIRIMEQFDLFQYDKR